MTAIEMLAGAVGRTLVFGTLVGLIASCSEWQSDPDGFTEQERELIEGMKLLPTMVTPDLSNEVLEDPLARSLGQALFFDPELSGPLGKAQPDQAVYLGDAGVPGRISCADCHTPNGFFDDARSTPSNVSLGIDFTSRNSPSLVNVAFYRSWAWDGRSDSLWMQSGVAHESGRATGGTRPRLARRIAAVYAPTYEAVFGDAGFARLPEVDGADGGPRPGSDDALYLNGIAANSYKAMAAYITQLISVNAPIDAYASANLTALSPEQKRGLKLFLGRAGCVECHSGANFTDNQFHSVGVPQRGEHVPAADDGRFEGLRVLSGTLGQQSVFNKCGSFGTKPDSGCPVSGPDGGELGQFRTKSLRNVGRTPPYMHAGQFQTLEEVVRFYNAGGDTTGFVGMKSVKIVPLGLTDAEIFDLVAFLHALTGTDPIPAHLACDLSRLDADAGSHRYKRCADGGL